MLLISKEWTNYMIDGLHAWMPKPDLMCTEKSVIQSPLRSAGKLHVVYIFVFVGTYLLLQNSLM